MKNKSLLTTLLILFFSLLIFLRLYGASQIGSNITYASTKDVSEEKEADISSSERDSLLTDEDADEDDSDKASSLDEAAPGTSSDSSDKDTSKEDEADKQSDSEADFSDESDNNGLMNDTWHGSFTPVRTYSGQLPRIVCWGDSLTESFNNKTAYPDYLRELSGCEVINYGLSNELTNMIAMREGGISVSVNATVIPSGTDLIPVFLESETGNKIFFLEYGDGGVNPCRIGGIEGTLSKLNDSYYFARSKAGERRSLDDGSSFETFAMSDKKEDDVLVIFTGTNDMPDTKSIYNIIDIQKKMLSYAGCDKYIIVGLTYAGGIPEIDAVNDILANEYEDHFLDIRSYILNYGLDDSGIIPTQQDIDDLGNGEIPASLRSDYVHGNKYFYELLANQVYRRMQYLGYLPLESAR